MFPAISLEIDTLCGTRCGTTAARYRLYPRYICVAHKNSGRGLRPRRPFSGRRFPPRPAGNPRPIAQADRRLRSCRSLRPSSACKHHRPQQRPPQPPPPRRLRRGGVQKIDSPLGSPALAGPVGIPAWPGGRSPNWPRTRLRIPDRVRGQDMPSPRPPTREAHFFRFAEHARFGQAGGHRP
jgi:hypothetical protein